MTSEGEVKKLIKELLAKYDIRPAKEAGTFKEAAGWYFMASSSGFGTAGLPDFLGHYLGAFWGIEAKAPGKEPSGFQLLQIGAVKASGGAVFVVDGKESLAEFEGWLKHQDMWEENRQLFWGKQ